MLLIKFIYAVHLIYYEYNFSLDINIHCSILKFLFDSFLFTRD